MLVVEGGSSLAESLAESQMGTLELLLLGCECCFWERAVSERGRFAEEVEVSLAWFGTTGAVLGGTCVKRATGAVLASSGVVLHVLLSG
jgi:hypothetical protein